MNEITRVVPYIVAGLAALCLSFAAVPPSDPEGEMHLQEFGRLPAVDNGRVKPLDTVARINLMSISGRQTYQDEQGRTQPAIKWLLETMTADGRVFKAGRSEASVLKVFRVENDQVLELLNLNARSGYRYSYEELAPKKTILIQRAELVRRKPEKKHDVFDRKVLQLDGQLALFEALGTLRTPYLVPPTNPGEDWKRIGEGLYQELQAGQKNGPAHTYGEILKAYSEGAVGTFNREVAAYRQRVGDQIPEDSARAGFEQWFNNFSPFYVCALVYVLVFLVACVSWLTSTPTILTRTAFWLALVALVVHTGALLARMYLSQRPLVFVTNLYSSAVFIAWMAVILGLILEWIYRNGIGAALAGLTGAASLVVAHHLGSEGDTLEMLQAVLDTNFWLATHVTTVAIGYAATFVAGFLGMTFIILGVFTPLLKKNVLKVLTQMIYGIVCFAMLFSFVGTVLGGIWADQSWGRFWGWDPKENGALLIVIWNALILHARWAGMIKQRGLAVLAVGGNMVTGWSWFGTNQLGVGLHAYGFNNTLATGLTIFWGFNLLVLFLGVLPLSCWCSFAPAAPAAALAAAGALAPAPVVAPVPKVQPAPKPGSRKRRGPGGPTGIRKK